ncbi:MAG TPA: hypothetical protein VHR66_16720 [Gemmataceae bacterium]|nr:hypothetical protein [Gemmataceae bacterium]
MITIEDFDLIEAAHQKAIVEIKRIKKIIGHCQEQLDQWAFGTAVDDWPTASEMTAAIDAARRTKGQLIAAYKELPDNLKKRIAEPYCSRPMLPTRPPPE